MPINKSVIYFAELIFFICILLKKNLKKIDAGTQTMIWVHHDDDISEKDNSSDEDYAPR